MNRAIGVSLDDIDDDGLDEREAFSAASGLPPSLEVLRGRQPGCWTGSAAEGPSCRGSAMSTSRPSTAVPCRRTRRLAVREVTTETIPEWLSVLRAGVEAHWPEDDLRSDEMACAAHAVPGATAYLADLDGATVGCASPTPDEGVAWLGGAATTPSGRRRGVQGALVRHRLAVAAATGCDLAVVAARPAGTSARNLARLGFTLTFCQTVLTRP